MDTPPVTDPGAWSDEPEGSSWDGRDRRKTDPLVRAVTQAVAQAGSKPPVSPTHPLELVRDAALVGLAVLNLFLLFLLAGRLGDSNDDQQQFRDSLSCFLVRTVQDVPQASSDPQKAANGILVDCGFIETPGNRR